MKSTYLPRLFAFLTLLMILACSKDTDTASDDVVGEDDTENPLNEDPDSEDPDPGDPNSEDPFSVTLHSSKNAVHMILPNTISVDDPNEFDGNAQIEVTEKVYERFKDEFDWVILVTNREDNPGFGYSGQARSGFYNFAPNLKGIIHMPFNRAIKYGPMTHELGHRWTPHKGLYLYSKADEANGLHPAADGRDPLGGGTGATLREVTVDPNDESNSTVITTTLEDGGTFEADIFGRVANGGNSIPYNGQSMFEMGFISWDQAGYIWVPTNAEFLRSEYTSNGGYTRFSADKIEKMSVEDFAKNELGVTQNNPVNNEQTFKILVVLLDNETPSDAEFDLVSEHTEWLTLAGDDGNDGLFNFWEATNELGTLISGPLDQDLK
ncbi:MAG: hypothetical protein AB3N14_03475 [Flavobacteriaceae bacterium]